MSKAALHYLVELLEKRWKMMAGIMNDFVVIEETHTAYAPDSPGLALEKQTIPQPHHSSHYHLDITAKKPILPNRSTHVVPNSNGGWDSRQSGGQRSSGHFDTKQNAIDRARKISRNQATKLAIHNKDGKISVKDSHSTDPFPPTGSLHVIG